MLWSFGGIVWKGIEKKAKGWGAHAGISSSNQLRIFQGAIFSFGFFGWQLPSDDFAGRVCIPYTHSSRCWPLREINSKVQKGGSEQKWWPPWGRTWNATNSDPEEVFLGHVMYVYIYIYCIYIIIHTYFFKREGKNSSTNGKWVVWVGDLGF